IAKNRIHAVFIREERPNPDNRLLQLADANADRMCKAIPNASVHRIPIFATDSAAVGGRLAVVEVRKIPLAPITDVCVDLSALSVGVAYPIIRRLNQKLSGNSSAANLHLLVNDEPLVDGAIHPEATDRASTVHGFQGGFGLDANSRAIKLWLPHLIHGKGT